MTSIGQAQPNINPKRANRNGLETVTFNAPITAQDSVTSTTTPCTVYAAVTPQQITTSTATSSTTEADRKKSFYEECRIVDPNSEAGIKFQALGERVKNRLIPANDKRLGKKSFTYLIADTNDINAFIHTKTNTIVYTKGLLALIENEAQFAHILGHEIGHKVAVDRYGPATQASKIEETIVNTVPLDYMLIAGYDPKEAIKISNKIHDHVQTPRYEQILDVHPSNQIEVRTLVDMTGALIVKYGCSTDEKLSEKRTQLLSNNPESIAKESLFSNELSDINDKSKHNSYYDNWQISTGFDSLTTPKKINLLIEEVKTNSLGKYETGSFGSDLNNRTKDLIKLIEKTKIHNDDTQSQALVENFLEDLLTNKQYTNRFKIFHKAFEAAYFSNTALNRYNAICPTCVELHNGAINLIEATFFSEASSAAENIENTVKTLNSFARNNLKIINFPSFSWCEDEKTFNEILQSNTEKMERRERIQERLEGITNKTKRAELTEKLKKIRLTRFEMPWRVNHLEWAKHDSTIALSLMRIGVEDPKMIDCMDLPDLLKTREGRFLKLANVEKSMVLGNASINWEKGLITPDEVAIKIDGFNYFNYIQQSITAMDSIIKPIHVSEIQDIEAFMRDFYTPDGYFGKDIYNFTNPLFTSVDEVILTQDDYTNYSQNITDLTNKLSLILEQNTPESKDFIRHFFLNPEGGINQLIKDGKHICLKAYSTGDNSIYDVKDPLYPFFRDKALDLFTVEERIEILDKLCHNESRIELNYSEYEKYFNLLKLLDIKPPETLPELESACQQLAKFIPDYDTYGYFANHKIKSHIVCKFLKNSLEAKDFDKLVFEHTNLLEIYLTSEESRTTIKEAKAKHSNKPSKLKKDITDYINNLTLDENTSIEDLAKRFKVSERLTIPTKLSYLDSLKTALTNKIESLNPSEKQKTIEDLLLAEPVIVDYSFRSYLINSWTDCILNKFGTDDGTTEYKKDIEPVLENIKNISNLPLRYDISKVLAEKLVSQRELSYLFRDAIESGNIRETLSKKGLELSGINLYLDQLESHEANDLINYLMNPLDAKAGAILLTDLKEAGKAYTEWSEDDLTKNLYLGSDYDPRFLLPARSIHEEFWAMPLVGRVKIMRDLLFPLSEERTIKKEAQKSTKSAAEEKALIESVSKQRFVDSCHQVMDILFPRNNTEENRAKKITMGYIDLLEPELQPLFLAALITASKTYQETGEQLSIGERLALVLEVMGPAETKFGQGLHSHPDTPEKIREGLGRLKSKASPYTRWELWNRIEEVMPEWEEIIARLGPSKGSASFFVAAQMTPKTGDSEIITLQREHARAKALRGYDLIQKLAEKIGDESILGKNSEDAKDTIVDIVEGNKQIVDIETCSAAGLKQVDIAKKLYNGVTIKVGKRKFNFKTADWTGTGEEYRRQKEMPGVHFNDLPETTNDEKSYKSDFAKAYLTLELINILKGKEFDPDRHGSQLKIDGENVGLFDHGALSFEVPTKKDKEGLVTLIANTFSAYQTSKNKSIGTLMYQELRKLKKQSSDGKTPPYLIKVVTAMLKLNDFMRYIKPEDIQDILIAVYNSNTSDKDIQEFITARSKDLLPSGNKLSLMSKLMNPKIVFTQKA